MLSLIVLALLAALHPDSLSATTITVDGDEVWLEMRTQVLSLLEVLPTLDVDDDGVVTADEVAAHRDAIAAYVSAHYVLTTGTDREGEGGVDLVPEAMGVLHHAPGIEQALGYRAGAVDIALRFGHDGPVRDLAVRCDLFRETSPLHIDTLALTWEGGETYRFGLDARAPGARVDPEGRGAVSHFGRRARERFVAAWEGWAFLLALVVAARGRRALVLTAGPALVAHGVAVALSARGLVDVGPWQGFVEAAGALAMAYLAADVLLQPDAERPRWPEALAFGALLGLAAGASLREPLQRELHPGLGLTGWLVATVAAQLTVVVVAGLVAGRVGRSSGSAGLPPRTRRAAAWVMVAAGLAGFVLRL